MGSEMIKLAFQIGQSLLPLQTSSDGSNSNLIFFFFLDLNIETKVSVSLDGYLISLKMADPRRANIHVLQTSPSH